MAIPILGLLVDLFLAALSLGLALFILILGFLGYHQVKNYINYYRSGCNVPYVPEKPFIGSFRSGSQYVHRYNDALRYGHVVYSTWLHLPLISVCDPDIIQFVTQSHNYPKSPFVCQLQQYWGRNLFNMQHGEDGKWKKERKLVDPAFRVRVLKLMHHSFAHHAVQFTQGMIQQAEQGVGFDIMTEIGKMTLDVISSAAFSHPLHAMDYLNPDEIDKNEIKEKNGPGSNPFVEAVLTFMRVNSPLILLPFGPNLKAFLERKELQLLDQTFYKVIDQRIADLDKYGYTNEIKDLLDAMLRSDESGNRLSREELRNELFVFYLAGYNTTLTLLSWVFYELCHHPEVEKKLIEELESVMGPINEKAIVPPTNQQIESLSYMKMVINETLRLYSPVPSISRVMDETTEIKGFIFPKGCTVACNIYALHHNATIWPDPFKFDPERFSKENSGGRHIYAFIPFAAGPRICIGRNFLYFQVKIFLSTLLRSIRFELDETHQSDNGKLNPNESLVKPTHVYVRARKRN